jgi:NADP-dependent 3-hydroxy acid dehydrogenase YdfG
MDKLFSKIVFITGASSGIGKACATAFAKEGADLILTARRISNLKKFSLQLIKKYKIKVFAARLDVRNEEEVSRVISSIPKDLKRIDILINNAGLARGYDKFYEGKIADWQEMIDTNVKGLLYITREILPSMVKRKRGHIINIGSTAGHDVYPNGNVYCATKYAVKALTRSIRIDVLDKNIKVSTVDPGMVETEFSIVRFSGDKEKAKNVYKGIHPLSANDVADAVVYCTTRPEHVNINEIILTPIAQASPNHIIRKIKD